MLRPRIERIHHLAIAVSSLERALDLWRDALGVSPDIREFPEHRLREAAFPVGDIEIRLWQSLDGEAHDGLRQIGLQVSDFEDAVHACRAQGLEPGALAPTAVANGRRHRLSDATGAVPHFELLEIRTPVASLPVRPLRTVVRPAPRAVPAARGRSAKVAAPSKAAAVKSARAPRPSLRSRGKVRRGDKK